MSTRDAKIGAEILAQDLMQTEVITLSETASIREAVQTFEECNIKGAPVVDGAGRPVGVITSSDIARTGHLADDRISERRGDYYMTDPDDDLGPDGSRRSEEFLGKEDYSPEVSGPDTVADWMTPNIVSVAPEATLIEVCKLMSTEGIHRVLVVRNSKVLGILSAMDIVRTIGDQK